MGLRTCSPQQNKLLNRIVDTHYGTLHTFADAAACDLRDTRSVDTPPNRSRNSSWVLHEA